MLCFRAKRLKIWTALLSPGQTDSQVVASWKLGLLATPFGQALRALALSCDDFGRDQICTQVNGSFLPFGHPTQVSSQVQLVATCDYLRVCLTRALGYLLTVVKFGVKTECEAVLNSHVFKSNLMMCWGMIFAVMLRLAYGRRAWNLNWPISIQRARKILVSWRHSSCLLSDWLDSKYWNFSWSFDIEIQSIDLHGFL